MSGGPEYRYRRCGWLCRVADVLLATMLLAVSACSSAGGSSTGNTGTASPKPGGAITLGGFNFRELDPGQAGYISGGNAYLLPVYGSLFMPAPGTGRGVVPSLATGYSFSDSASVLTIKLRHNLKFQDGTALDAAAVVWNLQRYSTPQSTNNQYLNTATSITATAPDQVTIKFSQPNSPIIEAFANTSAGFMASPSAFQRMGAANFGVSPVGAGPFEIKSTVPFQTTVLGKASTYWDAKHVYLDQITLKNTGTDQNVQYTDLASGALQETQFSGITAPPSVIAQAKSNTQLKSKTSPNVQYDLLPMNTFVAPFNNQMAREAVSYCMDRDAIANDLQQGYATPAYVLSGTDGDFFPAGGVKGAKSLTPYPYNVSKGKAIVQSLGGLSFEVQVYTELGQTMATALAQQWSQCGIKAKITNVQPPAFLTNVGTGAYQMGLTQSGGAASPELWTTYQTPTTPLGKYGFRDADMLSLIHQTYATTDPAKLTQLWKQIWQRENTLAVDLPLVSSGSYVFYNKCLGNLNFYGSGIDFTHAYLTCSV